VVKFADLIFFARPMLLIPVWTIYLHYMVQCHGKSSVTLVPGRSAVVHLIVLTLIFAGSYILNQIFDIESDRINDKLFFLPRKIISVPVAWALFVSLSAGGMIIAAFAESRILPAVLMLVVLGVLYSAPVIRLKDRPLAGLAANAAGYGLLIPWIAAWNCPERAVSTLAIPYCLAIAAGYVLTTIPDRKGDAASGKRTVAVIFGSKGTLWPALVLIAAAGATSIWAGNIELAMTAVVTAVICVYLIVSYSRKMVMAACKAPILLLTIFAAVHYPIYGVILLLTYFLTRLYYIRQFGIVYPRLD
jgi:4-hydroxybenzoate polyprenyltransferase